MDRNSNLKFTSMITTRFKNAFICRVPDSCYGIHTTLDDTLY